MEQPQDLSNKIINSLQEQLGKEYKFGENDCVHFTANILKELTGKDYLVNYRNKYTSALEGYKLFKKNGFESIEDVVTQELDIEPQEIHYARAGDVLSFDTSNGIAIGICFNNIVGVFVTDSGIHVEPIEKCRKVWRII